MDGLNYNTVEYNMKKDMLSQEGKNSISEIERDNNSSNYNDENYEKIVKILKNIYIKGSGDEARKRFLEKVIIKGNSDNITTEQEDSFYITDNDIEVAQQLAIWYYTNKIKPDYFVNYLGNEGLSNIYQAIYQDEEKTQEHSIINDIKGTGSNQLKRSEDLANVNLGRT